MKDDVYFAFPLSILAYPPARKPRGLDLAIYDAVSRLAKATYSDVDFDDERVVAYAEEHDISDAEEYPGFVVAASTLNVDMHGGLSSRLLKLENFQEWHERQGRSKQIVRIRSDLFWEAYQDRMPQRRFAVLCGLYARIGAKNYAKVSVEDLQRLAAGLASRDELKRHRARRIADRIDAAEILSPDKIRYTVTRLVADSLVTRYTFNRGETFYAHPARHPTTESLREAVLRSKAKRRGMEREVANKASADELEAFLLGVKKSQRI